MKKCDICGIEKELSEFYSQKKHSNKKGNYIYYNPECKECTRKRSSQYQKDNPEWTKSYSKKIYKRKEQYFKDKAKRWSRENEEQAKSLQRDWRQNNPDIISEYNIDRRLHKKHDITNSEWEQCKEYYNYECAYCGITETDAEVKYKNRLHKDHANPNGSNDISNCIPACKSCNSSKHDSELDDWFNDNNINYTNERNIKINNWLQCDYLITKNLI